MDNTIGRMTISPDELDLTHTLTPGQSFRWKMNAEGRWTGVVRRRVVRVWREGGDICYQIFPGGPDDDFIGDYFRLDIKLADVYRDFIQADGRLVEAVERFKGLRVIRQEPEETLLSYICSAANSVSRISGSVEIMSERWGDFIATVDGHDYYAFPTSKALADADPDELASVCGLGFRGVNVNLVAKQLVDRSVEWLNSLRKVDYEDARAGLLGFRGVGQKIADCVLLFSLNQDNAFPVDTHVRHMAVKYYLPEFRQKTLTPAVYQQIVDYFQAKFGRYAGWAQEYLFYDDLLRRKPSKEAATCSR
jgi:N-glycosylase/DNA lyase